LKQTGSAQDIVMGRGRLSVEWYGSLREMAHGLEKNAFASMEYSVPATVLAVVVVLLLFMAPFLGMAWTGGLPRILFGATYVLQALATAESARRLGLDPWLGPMFPFSAGFLAYVVVRSMVVTAAHGQGSAGGGPSIRWRS
jgi:hypothetical protein